MGAHDNQIAINLETVNTLGLIVPPKALGKWPASGLVGQQPITRYGSLAGHWPANAGGSHANAALAENERSHHL